MAIVPRGYGLSGRGLDELRLPALIESTGEGLLPWQVRRVQHYLDGGLGGRVSLRAAAEQARLSPGYFSRRFRRHFGVTFMRFVARKRIERARELMARSGSSLSQIAIACGFTDQAHFTRTFGSLMGSTPSRWRRHAIQASALAAPDRRQSGDVMASSPKP